MGRPVGVTIIAVLYFLGTALCILLGIAMFAGGGMLATLVGQSGGQGSGVGAGFLAGLGAAMGVMIIIIGGLEALLGWAMLKLKEWARIVTIVLAGLSILGSLFGMLAVFSHFGLFVFMISVIRLAIAALIIWYLLQPDVKAAFQGQARAVAA